MVSEIGDIGEETMVLSGMPPEVGEGRGWPLPGALIGEGVMLSEE